MVINRVCLFYVLQVDLVNIYVCILAIMFIELVFTISHFGCTEKVT